MWKAAAGEPGSICEGGRKSGGGGGEEIPRFIRTPLRLSTGESSAPKGKSRQERPTAHFLPAHMRRGLPLRCHGSQHLARTNHSHRNVNASVCRYKLTHTHTPVLLYMSAHTCFHLLTNRNTTEKEKRRTPHWLSCWLLPTQNYNTRALRS